MEATRLMLNPFIFRIMLLYGCDREMTIKFCEFNIGKQPYYMWICRNFTQLDFSDLREFLGGDDCKYHIECTAPAQKLPRLDAYKVGFCLSHNDDLLLACTESPVGRSRSAS